MKKRRKQTKIDATGWEETLKVPDETKKSIANEVVTRVPVNFNYTALNWDFLKLMAEIPPYADEKYTTWTLYTKERMEGEKSPINHLIEHARSYMAGEPYDKFDKDVGRHLVAIAYNAMMEWYYLRKFGFKAHPLVLEHRTPIGPIDLDALMKNAMMAVMVSSIANHFQRKRRKRKKKR